MISSYLEDLPVMIFPHIHSWVLFKQRLLQLTCFPSRVLFIKLFFVLELRLWKLWVFLYRMYPVVFKNHSIVFNVQMLSIDWIEDVLSRYQIVFCARVRFTWNGGLAVWDNHNNQGCGAGTGRNRIHLGTLEPEPEPYSEYGSGSGSEYKKMKQKTQKN
jgi:hypothetical protein